MKVLVVPMFALSRMGGPWSRAQAVAAAFAQTGHEVVLGIANDGNCVNPVTTQILELPTPAPLGLPMAVAGRTFPLATCLGIVGRKPVHSFEEVLWLTGNLAPRFDFATLLPRARLFVHHGGQNATMDGFAYGVPQVIVPGKIFERIFNADSVQRAGAGIKLDTFDGASLADAYARVRSSDSYAEAACGLRTQLASLGVARAIVSAITAFGAESAPIA